MYLFFAVAGCGMTDRQCNEDIADELAVVDISTAVKIVVNCYNVWKECRKNRIRNPLHYCNCKFRLYLSLKTGQFVGNVSRYEHFDVARFECSDSNTDEDLIGVCRWMHVAEGRSPSMLTYEISVCA